MKIKKDRAKNGFLRKTLTDSKEPTFADLKKHASAPVRKERLSPASTARREAHRNKLYGKERDARQSRKL